MELVTKKLEDQVLTLMLHGRVDSNNFAEAEKLIQGFCAANDTEQVVLDVDDLEYISSAGLRVILRLKKQKKELRIINASTDVFEIFEMTGFSEMIPVEKAYRKLKVDGCEIIGKGAKGTVYRYNQDTIVKVYHNSDSLPAIQRERELARKAFVLGIPTAISYDVVRVDDKFGSVFELLDAKPYSALLREDPQNFDKYVKDYAEMLRLIHDTTVKPDDMPDAKILVKKWLTAVAPYFDEADNAKLAALVEAIPDTLNMLHGDYHTNNIMMQNGETLMIDMDTLSHGHPVIELANVHVTYVGFTEIDPANVRGFLGLTEEESVKVWEKFLPIYLQTDDADRLREVEEKASLLSYTRGLRHYVRRDPESAVAKRAIEVCTAKIHDLLQKVDTLDF